jgi:LacI family transcriptional regulator
MALQSAGLRVPQDISIIGFDNEADLMVNASVALNTVQLPHEEMGRQAVRSLIDVANGNINARSPRTLKIECDLIPGTTIAAPRPAGKRPGQIEESAGPAARRRKA